MRPPIPPLDDATAPASPVVNTCPPAVGWRCRWDRGLQPAASSPHGAGLDGVPALAATWSNHQPTTPTESPGVSCGNLSTSANKASRRRTIPRSTHDTTTTTTQHTNKQQHKTRSGEHDTTTTTTPQHHGDGGGCRRRRRTVGMGAYYGQRWAPVLPNRCVWGRSFCFEKGRR
jgi:hypothetical protein